MKTFPTIKVVRTYITKGVGAGGDYHNVKRGHWLIDNSISVPMSKYEEYRASRVSWGINVLGSFCVEIEASDGTTGFATGFGGPPACWIVHHHLERFLIGADPRALNRLSDQMFRSTMFYGRKGLPVATISVVDLALWDLIGKIRAEPVYQMIGGNIKDELDFYCTGPAPVATKEAGFWGAKVPLPYGPDEGAEGLRKNVAFLTKHRESVGPDFPLMVDCWMSLTVQYAIELATACLHLNINWWEEVLPPDDISGYAIIKQALPHIKFTTGEHEYTKYGFRELIAPRTISILQPDVMWVGGLTELLKITAQASAYDIPVVPHASGAYSYHFVVSQANCPFQEYLNNSPDGTFGEGNRGALPPVFGTLFESEPTPVGGKLKITQLDSEQGGFGLVVSQQARQSTLVPGLSMVMPDVAKPLAPAEEEEKKE
ncbi:L-rhamnonate dehydratase [Mycena kentingensis (nom. inval.)]|nr:L-rhamnonate dehydratase [Mycena kentingensis (nom. inval.)]